jgi:uncharacterized membrane protein SirB2
MSYLLLKHLHMGLAATSGLLFLLRGMWMLARSPLLQRSWVRTLPHCVDSLLLASALGLAYWSGQTPLNSAWLGPKIVALIAYIVLGAFALRYGKTMRQRASALVAALACFAYIVLTAVSKNPLFFL